MAKYEKHRKNAENLENEFWKLFPGMDRLDLIAVLELLDDTCPDTYSMTADELRPCVKSAVRKACPLPEHWEELLVTVDKKYRG